MKRKRGAIFRCAEALEALGNVCDAAHLQDNPVALRQMAAARFQIRKLARCLKEAREAIEMHRRASDNAGLDDVIASIFEFPGSGR